MTRNPAAADEESEPRSSISKGDLVKAVARKVGRPVADVDETLTGLIDVIELALAAGQDVSWRGFGKLELRWRSPVTKPNPRTGAPMTVEGRYAVVFVPAPRLKGRVNDG